MKRENKAKRGIENVLEWMGVIVMVAGIFTLFAYFGEKMMLVKLAGIAAGFSGLVSGAALYGFAKAIRTLVEIRDALQQGQEQPPASTVETNVAQIKTVVGQIAYLLKQQAGDGKK